MNVYTKVGTRIRMLDTLDSPIIKTYVQNDLELVVLEKKPSEDGMWYKVKDGETEGWVKSKFVNFKK